MQTAKVTSWETIQANHQKYLDSTPAENVKDDIAYRATPEPYLHPESQWYLAHWQAMQFSRTDHGLPISEIVCYVHNMLGDDIDLQSFVGKMNLITACYFKMVDVNRKEDARIEKGRQKHGNTR